MEGLPEARFRPHERLTTAAQYRRVFRSGLRLDGPLFLLVAAVNDLGYDRIGIAASRKVGRAVERNRVKRVLRESFRHNKAQGKARYDLVLVPKREMARAAMGEVEREYRERLRRLAGSFRPRHTRPAAGD